jgi:hypothetical protein
MRRKYFSEAIFMKSLTLSLALGTAVVATATAITLVGNPALAASFTTDLGYGISAKLKETKSSLKVEISGGDIPNNQDVSTDLNLGSFLRYWTGIIAISTQHENESSSAAFGDNLVIKTTSPIIHNIGPHDDDGTGGPFSFGMRALGQLPVIAGPNPAETITLHPNKHTDSYKAEIVNIQGGQETNSIISWKFELTGVHIPEPSSTLGFLALGTLGAALTIKRKLKPSQSTEKETTKVS